MSYKRLQGHFVIVSSTVIIFAKGQMYCELGFQIAQRKIKFEFQKELNDENIRAASYTF